MGKFKLIYYHTGRSKTPADLGWAGSEHARHGGKRTLTLNCKYAAVLPEYEAAQASIEHYITRGFGSPEELYLKMRL